MLTKMRGLWGLYNSELEILIFIIFCIDIEFIIKNSSCTVFQADNVLQ